MTTATAISAIDWQAPWWQPWRELGARVAERVRVGESVHAALNACRLNSSVKFVPQSALPDGMAYEAFIFETKTVPTRDKLHDFFNGLAWLRFPTIKARLNALQYAQIQKDGVKPLRGVVRDVLTLFDENAAFLCAERHASVIAALRTHDWQAAFQTHRNILAAHPPLLFGHALLEKLVCPYKSIVAHVFPVKNVPENVAAGAFWTDLSALDAAIAHPLDAASLTPKPFLPLPVLGVPNWWMANEMPDFYADSTVFRPPRP